MLKSGYRRKKLLEISKFAGGLVDIQRDIGTVIITTDKVISFYRNSLHIAFTLGLLSCVKRFCNVGFDPCQLWFLGFRVIGRTSMSRKFIGWMALGVFAVAVAGFGGSAFGGHCGDYDDDDDNCGAKKKCGKPARRCGKPVRRCGKPAPRKCCQPRPMCCKPRPTCSKPAPKCAGSAGGGAGKKAPGVPGGDSKPPTPGKGKKKGK